MLLERTNVNPDQPDTEYGRTPLSWATQTRHEGVVKMLLERKHVHPGLLLAAHDERPRLLDYDDSVPMSAGSGLSAQSRWLSRPLSNWPLKLFFRRTKTKTHPSNTQPTLSAAADRRFIISAHILLLLAFLLYFISSSLLDILLSHKELPSVG